MGYERQQAAADDLIRRRGRESKLRRSTGDRACWALEAVLNATDRRALKNPTNRVFIISAVGLAVPPADDEDSLVWIEPRTGEERVLRQDAPVVPFAPDGGVVIYYELQVKG